MTIYYLLYLTIFILHYLKISGYLVPATVNVLIKMIIFLRFAKNKELYNFYENYENLPIKNV